MEAIKFSSFELNLTDEVINRLADLGYTQEGLKEAIIKHEWKHGSDSPAIYCGTYGKYNSGNLRGMWVDVSTFDYYEEFENFCLAIHADEDDPELMYQDFSNMPGSLYHESMGEEEFNKIAKYCELCDDYSVEAVDDFLKFYKPEYLDMMPNAYEGAYCSREEFAKGKANEDLNLEKMMGSLIDYFDYASYARDLFINYYHYGSHGSVIRKF